MKLRTRKKTPAEQLKQAAIEAAVTALGDLQDRSNRKPALSGVRAVGTGALLVTAARAAFKGRRFLREQLSSNEAEGEETTKAREERAEPEAGKYQAAQTMQADEQAEAGEEKEHRHDAAEQDEPEASDEVEAVEHAEASDEDDDESTKDDARDDDTGDDGPEARPLPDRKPVRRPARRQGLQPSLELPQHRWPRLSARKR